jgi:hypothetical protein
MRAMARPQFGRAFGPAGNDLAAARHRDAVVEAEVALVLAHAAPVRGAECRIHDRIHLVIVTGNDAGDSTFCGKWSTRLYHPRSIKKCGSVRRLE